jgi:hypothetical protein
VAPGLRHQPAGDWRPGRQPLPDEGIHVPSLFQFVGQLGIPPPPPLPLLGVLDAGGSTDEDQAGHPLWGRECSVEGEPGSQRVPGQLDRPRAGRVQQQTPAVGEIGPDLARAAVPRQVDRDQSSSSADPYAKGPPEPAGLGEAVREDQRSVALATGLGMEGRHGG